MSRVSRKSQPRRFATFESRLEIIALLTISAAALLVLRTHVSRTSVEGELLEMRFSAHKEAVRCVAFSSDGTKLVTGSTAKIWDSATGKVIRSLVGHEETVRSAVFSPDGARVATSGEDKTAKIWDVASWF
jgi:WD40 repeat protein